MLFRKEKFFLQVSRFSHLPFMTKKVANSQRKITLQTVQYIRSDHQLMGLKPFAFKVHSTKQLSVIFGRSSLTCSHNVGMICTKRQHKLEITLFFIGNKFSHAFLFLFLSSFQSTPPYMSGYSYRGFGVDSPHRASIRSTSSFPGASGSVSSFHDNLRASPRGTVPQTNSRGNVLFQSFQTVYNICLKYMLQTDYKQSQSQREHDLKARATNLLSLTSLATFYKCKYL